MATDLERLNLVVQNKENLRNAFIEIGEDVDETTPFSEYADIVKALPSKAIMTDIRNAVNTKGGELTADTPYSEYPAAISSLESGGDDYLKLVLDATQQANYLLSNYTGTSISGLVKSSHFSNVTQMQYTFQNCINLTEIPLLDTSNVTNMNSMFYYCSNLTSIPLLDTSNVTNMSSMFYYCSNLTEVPLLDTSNVTYMGYMFYQCERFETFPQFDTSKVTNMTNICYYNCYRLKTIPVLNTSNVTNMSRAFQACYQLETVEGLDLIKVTSNTGMFANCSKLTNLTLYNIKASLQIGSGTAYGHLLTVDSLVNCCKECINTGSSRTLTMGTANTEKLASVYVKFTDSSVTTIATDTKGEVEVCESTDTGAMLIENYMLLKNWQIA